VFLCVCVCDVCVCDVCVCILCVCVCVCVRIYMCAGTRGYSILCAPFLTHRTTHTYLLKHTHTHHTHTHTHSMDLMLGGDLKFHLINAGRFIEKRARFYAAEVLLALEHIHSLGILYRCVCVCVCVCVCDVCVCVFW